MLAGDVRGGLTLSAVLSLVFVSCFCLFFLFHIRTLFAFNPLIPKE